MVKRYVDIELLVPMVKERPAIWDKTLDIYKDKNKTRTAWREICARLRDDFEGLEEKQKQLYVKMIASKWYNVRDNWLKAYKKSKGERSSATGRIRRKYIFYDHLTFLQKVYPQQETSDMDITSRLSISDDSLSEPTLEPDRKRKASDFDAKASNAPEGSPPTVQKRERSDSQTTLSNAPKSSEQPAQKQGTSDSQTKSSNVRENPYKIPESITDPHMLFFVSVLPLMSQFTQNDTLEFRMGVLNLIKTIREQSEKSCSSNTIKKSA